MVNDRISFCSMSLLLQEHHSNSLRPDIWFLPPGPRNPGKGPSSKNEVLVVGFDFKMNLIRD